MQALSVLGADALQQRHAEASQPSCMGLPYSSNSKVRNQDATDYEHGLVTDEIERLIAQVWGTGAKSEVVMLLLGLGHCRDTLVGDGGLMMRGISGGERKRLTTAEMVVGPQRVLLMDEISTGLDSATLYSVITFFTSVSDVENVPAQWEQQLGKTFIYSHYAVSHECASWLGAVQPALFCCSFCATYALSCKVCASLAASEPWHCIPADVTCAEPHHNHQPATAASRGLQPV